MCGIVGYIGREGNASDVLIDGLRRLEYRGYDSAGVAIFDGDVIDVRRAEGKLNNLEGEIRTAPIEGRVGIGHTRWATHGKPSERNAHPQRAGSVVIVHNGIIENYRELRRQLEADGRTIESDTDTELIAHCIEQSIDQGNDLLAAVREACGRLTGAYALAALSERDPTTIVAAKNGGSPMILGLGEKQAFLASDIPAILPYTRNMAFIEDGEFAVLRESGIEIFSSTGAPSPREFKTVLWDPISAEK
ncbi:MAG: glutamine--fructose-6-phosphate transaminase (isomerizing), partial [bacterium]